ncbi:MAG: methyl-accepting chemotaxis protein [Pseudomonadota bacterium]
MKPTEKRNPIEVLEKIKAVVGPMRSAVFEICAHLSTLSSDDDEAMEEIERIKGLSANILEAREMLSNGARKMLESLAGKVPQDLQDAQDQARNAIGSVEDKLGPLVQAAEDGTISPAAVRPVLVAAQTEMRPKIDAFLKALADHFEDERKKHAADDRDLIKSAMQEIDNISMSINLISLNASVEAARAGEAGRGFAVIAAEIQSLSSESKKAVDSIRQRLA